MKNERVTDSVHLLFCLVKKLIGMILDKTFVFELREKKIFIWKMINGETQNIFSFIDFKYP